MDANIGEIGFESGTSSQFGWVSFGFVPVRCLEYSDRYVSE